jgi:hypothetical protein
MTKSKDISLKNSKELALTDTEQNTILDRLIDGETAYEIAREKRISLRTLYKYLDQNPKYKDEFLKAQERGIKTLVEKMCVIFNTETTPLDNNELVFIREKKDWLKWIAPRLSSLFVEKTKQEVKQDTTLRVQWEDTPDLIDVDAEEISTPTPKD